MSAREWSIIENTIRVHGLLLEHETQRIVEETIVGLGNALAESQLSRTFVKRVDGKERTIEIDVFVEAQSYQTEILNDLYYEASPATDVEHFGFGARIREFYVIECKGHDRDGFLIGRSIAAVEEDKTFPLLISPENKRVKTRIGIGSLTVSMVHKAPERVSFEAPIIDWAYFYSGKTKSLRTNLVVHEQDKDAQTNKFLGAVEQLAEGLEVALEGRPNHSSDDVLFRVLPIVCTNADLLELEVAPKENRARIYSDVPWMKYKYRYAKESSWFSTGLMSSFWVVRSEMLAAFIQHQREMIDPRVRPSTLPPKKSSSSGPGRLFPSAAAKAKNTSRNFISSLALLKFL